MSADGTVEVEDALADSLAVGGDGEWAVEVEVRGVERGWFPSSQTLQREGAVLGTAGDASAQSGSASLTSTAGPRDGKKQFTATWLGTGSLTTFLISTLRAWTAAVSAKMLPSEPDCLPAHASSSST
jgi:hypothetical protein